MPGTKEIRMKIRSVQNTRKITKAMEMVAASKMRKAQEGMRRARPYGEKIRNVAAHISYANPEYRHPFLVERDPNRQPVAASTQPLPVTRARGLTHDTPHKSLS